MHDLSGSRFDDVIQFGEGACPSTVAKVNHFAVVFHACRLRIAVGALELFGFALFAIEDARDVARDVLTTERQHGEVAQQFAAIDGNGGGFAPHLDEGATGAAFLFVGHHVGQAVGSHGVAHNGETGLAETGFNGFNGAGIAHDVQKLCTDAVGHYSHRFDGGEGTHGVFLRKGVDENLVVADFVAVVGFERLDELLLYRDALGEGAFFNVGDGAHALAVERHIDLFDVAVDLIFEALADVFEALRHFVDVVHATFANEVGRGHRYIGEDVDSSFAVYASHHAGDFGGADGDGGIKGTIGIDKHGEEGL